MDDQTRAWIAATQEWMNQVQKFLQHVRWETLPMSDMPTEPPKLEDFA